MKFRIGTCSGVFGLGNKLPGFINGGEFID
jgi:hypothetical protein